MGNEFRKCTIGQVEQVMVSFPRPDMPHTGTTETICPGCKLHNPKFVLPVELGIRTNRLGNIALCAVNQLPQSEYEINQYLPIFDNIN